MDPWGSLANHYRLLGYTTSIDYYRIVRGEPVSKSKVHVAGGVIPEGLWPPHTCAYTELSACIALRK